MLKTVGVGTAGQCRELDNRDGFSARWRCMKWLACRRWFWERVLGSESGSTSVWVAGFLFLEREERFLVGCGGGRGAVWVLGGVSGFLGRFPRCLGSGLTIVLCIDDDRSDEMFEKKMASDTGEWHTRRTTLG